MEEYISIKDAADILTHEGFAKKEYPANRNNVVRLINKGSLKTAKILSKRVILRSSLDRYINIRKQINELEASLT